MFSKQSFGTCCFYFVSSFYFSQVLFCPGVFLETTEGIKMKPYKDDSTASVDVQSECHSVWTCIYIGFVSECKPDVLISVTAATDILRLEDDDFAKKNYRYLTTCKVKFFYFSTNSLFCKIILQCFNQQLLKKQKWHNSRVIDILN